MDVSDELDFVNEIEGAGIGLHSSALNEHHLDLRAECPPRALVAMLYGGVCASARVWRDLTTPPVFLFVVDTCVVEEELAIMKTSLTRRMLSWGLSRSEAMSRCTN
jgi:hypothetical protein